MWRTLAVVAAALALAAPRARALDPGPGIEAFVEALPSEDDECGFLQSMCRGAVASAGRAESTPSQLDRLVTKQALTASQQYDEANLAARAIERKHGKRLACFDQDWCAGILR